MGKDDEGQDADDAEPKGREQVFTLGKLYGTERSRMGRMPGIFESTDMFRAPIFCYLLHIPDTSSVMTSADFV